MSGDVSTEFYYGVSSWKYYFSYVGSVSDGSGWAGLSNVGAAADDASCVIPPGGTAYIEGRNVTFSSSDVPDGAEVYEYHADVKATVNGYVTDGVVRTEEHRFILSDGATEDVDPWVGEAGWPEGGAWGTRGYEGFSAATAHLKDLADYSDFKITFKNTGTNNVGFKVAEIDVRVRWRLRANAAMLGAAMLGAVF